MMRGKRILIATIAGLVFGVISYLLTLSFAPAVGVSRSGVLAIILSRGVLGFAIGISALRVRWCRHGAVMGFIFSLPPAFGAVWQGFGRSGLIWVLVLGIIFGFLVELVTSVLFKARMPENSGGAQPA